MHNALGVTHGGQGGYMPVAPQHPLTLAGIPGTQVTHVGFAPLALDGHGGKTSFGGSRPYAIGNGRGYYGDLMAKLTQHLSGA